MITYNEGTTISLENIPVTVNNVTTQVVNLVIKQDGNEVRLRLNDSGFGFAPLDFFNDFIDALYKEKVQSFGCSYTIQATNSTKAEDL